MDGPKKRPDVLFKAIEILEGSNLIGLLNKEIKESPEGKTKKFLLLTEEALTNILRILKKYHESEKASLKAVELGIPEKQMNAGSLIDHEITIYSKVIHWIDCIIANIVTSWEMPEHRDNGRTLKSEEMFSKEEQLSG